LRQNPRKRANNTRAQAPALLKGLIFTATGAAMTPSSTKKGARRYRYYVLMDVIKNRETYPSMWASAQRDLGNALRILGERELGTDRLEEAIAALGAALEEQNRDESSLGWAWTQTCLANAYRALGEREKNKGRLHEAMTTFHAALDEQTRERVPLFWAKTRESIAQVHIALFEDSRDARELDQAQAALDDARDPSGRHPENEAA
jgi:tetratricopeptide (TPR) repeat protein